MQCFSWPLSEIEQPPFLHIAPIQFFLLYILTDLFIHLRNKLNEYFCYSLSLLLGAFDCKHYWQLFQWSSVFIFINKAAAATSTALSQSNINFSMITNWILSFHFYFIGKFQVFINILFLFFALVLFLKPVWLDLKEKYSHIDKIIQFTQFSIECSQGFVQLFTPSID